MDSALIKAIGLKALLVGVGALLLFWTFNAIKLVISARGINPLVKKFFDQIAAGRIDGAYRLTTKLINHMSIDKTSSNFWVACN